MMKECLCLSLDLRGSHFDVLDLSKSGVGGLRSRSIDEEIRCKCRRIEFDENVQVETSPGVSAEE
jgi:hypothetical protein